MKILKISLTLMLFISHILCQEIDQLDELIDYLNKQGDNAKVGFLSGANYISVKRILPKNTKPIIVEHEEDLTQMILNGSLIAACVSGLPEAKYHDSIHIFSTTVVTMHSILMAPDNSTDYPHGNIEATSTYDLSLAINAALSRVQLKGVDLELAIKNAPKEIVQAHTCKEDDQTQFAVPNRKEAKGYLREILDKKEIRVLANGPFNWGTNDGNYLVDPPIGFYPDLLQAILYEFKNLSGPDKEAYGDINIKRVFTNQSPFPWYYLFDGTTHMTEPYFILDAPYGGSGKNCATDEDCFKANLPSGREICNLRCRHPNRPRYFMLRSSCTVLGSDSKFFTKRLKSNSKNDKSSLGAGTVVVIILLVLVTVGAIAGISFLIFREKRGAPVFRPL